MSNNPELLYEINKAFEEYNIIDNSLAEYRQKIILHKERLKNLAEDIPDGNDEVIDKLHACADALENVYVAIDNLPATFYVDKFYTPKTSKS